MKYSFIALTILLLLTATGCKPKKAKDKYTDTPTTGQITIAVDETFQPVIEPELPVFHAMYKGASIKAAYVPEVDAINMLLRDSVRLAIVSRPLSAKEINFFHSKKFFPHEVQLAVDGIAVLVNPSNPDTLFSVNTIRKILLSEITSWKQLNRKSPLGKIKVLFDNPNSSIVRFMVDSVTRTGQLGDQLSALQYNLDVVDYVSKNPDAIGLIGVSWVSNSRDPKCLSFLQKVKVAGISSEDPALPETSYQPFQAYIATGKYPFTRFVYALLTEPRAGLGSGFVSFVSCDKGQRIIQKTGVLPITQPVRIVHVVEE
ncbi:MAG TPA: substrate-binding domain-containing protein [Bacteroidales bacterium]|nr:substrate-binding domain-containing protein [Bacteroidales bacterium]HPT01525.1 substrate-binding domain-containing protein [Bacteroidales bacterium]